MAASDVQKLKRLEEENGKLKRIVADLTLDNTVLKDLLVKSNAAVFCVLLFIPVTVLPSRSSAARWAKVIGIRRERRSPSQENTDRFRGRMGDRDQRRMTDRLGEESAIWPRYFALVQPLPQQFQTFQTAPLKLFEITSHTMRIAHSDKTLSPPNSSAILCGYQ
jgi:hypothetical protein